MMTVVTAVVAVLVIRMTWTTRRTEITAWAMEVAGPVLFPPKRLPVASLQRRIVARCLSSVTVTVAGRAALPAHICVEVSMNDMDQISPLHNDVEEEITSMVHRAALTKGWRVPDDLIIRLIAGEAVDGRPKVVGEHEPLPAVHHQPRLTRPELPWPGSVEERTPQSAPHGGRVTAPLVVCELLPEAGGPAIDLTCRAEPLLVGREAQEVRVDHNATSAAHAELAPVGSDRWEVRDLNSLNGTWVNGHRVQTRCLSHNDVITFGRTAPPFRFVRLSR